MADQAHRPVVRRFEFAPEPLQLFGRNDQAVDLSGIVLRLVQVRRTGAVRRLPVTGVEEHETQAAQRPGVMAALPRQAEMRGKGGPDAGIPGFVVPDRPVPRTSHPFHDGQRRFSVAPLGAARQVAAMDDEIGGDGLQRLHQTAAYLERAGRQGSIPPDTVAIVSGGIAVGVGLPSPQISREFGARMATGHNIRFSRSSRQAGALMTRPGADNQRATRSYRSAER